VAALDFGRHAARAHHVRRKGRPAAWSPDGSRIAFVAKREWQGKKDDEPQVYLIAPDGGEARRLTQLATGVSGVKWFPDGKRIAFFSWVWPDLRGAAAQARRMKERKEDKVKAHVVEQYTYRFWDHWLADGRVPHLFVADVSSGACRDLFEGTPYELVRADPDQHVFDVSPDGRFIAFGYDPSPQKKLDDEFDLVELEVSTRRFRNLTQGEPHRDYHHPRYSPDGARIACLSADIRRNPRAQSQITLIERRAKRIEIVSRRWDRWVEAPLRWSGDGKEILCVAQDQARAHLYRFDLPSRSAQIAVTGGVVMEFDFAGGTTAYVRSEMDTPPAVYAGEDGARRKLERFNDALLKPFRFGPHRGSAVQGLRRQERADVARLPARFRPEKEISAAALDPRRPHTASSDGWHFRWCNHAFAAQGYVVAAVNYHGSSRSGRRSSIRSTPSTASASWRTSRRRPTCWCGAAISTGDACSPLAAATAATWSPG
jgi:dipeptidyl aminopeptidase/acylaminoacyl peptidase